MDWLGLNTIQTKANFKMATNIKKTDQERQTEDKIKGLEDRILELKRETNQLKTQVGYILDLLHVEAGALREFYTPCPGLEVGKHVLGNKIYGVVTKVMNGGGVWAGQELVVIDSVKDPIPSMFVMVL